MTARREERLKHIAHRLGVPVRIEPCDLSDEEECRKLCAKLADEHIDIFINNAGFGDCGEFIDTNLEKELNMIHVNIRAMHILLKFNLRQMSAYGKGQILNVASSAGILPAGPYMATYYATKSYVVSLTKAIAEELKENQSNVYVGALCPGPVDTEFNDRADVIFATKGISATSCVRAALRGMTLRKTIIVPYLPVRVGMKLQKFLPDKCLLPIIANFQKRKF
ncbi:3-oxoacyl-[acyl-carrier protein] reductase [Lachnospiraceae bacterium TWA4]|nr:3-oxoacyl-[acyl-carrier protein] reductase [Lachnospiraceae bacterium TWA4]